MLPHISAVICTHNRACYLRKALNSLLQQTLPPAQFEIVVVDNRSSDKTQEVVLEEFSDCTNLRYVYEPLLGLSQARNTGWQRALGEYVAYLDDDAIASPEWLEKILVSFEHIHPRPGVVCGKVEPIWENPRPLWVSDRLVGYFSVIDYSDKPIFLEDKYFCGANMAFPTEVLKESGGFNINLGRKGKNLLSNEELLLRKELQQLSYSIYYHPKVCVKHHVPPDRIAKRWLLTRAYWQGISNAALLLYLDPLSFSQKAVLISRSLKESYGVLKQLLRPITLSSSQKRVETMHKLCLKVGYIVGLR